MKTKTTHKFLAAILAFMMVLQLLPASVLQAFAASEGKIDVWDFGAQQLDPTVYNNMLSEDEINSWYADTEPGTTGKNIASFTSSDGLLSFNDGGKATTHRLRSTNPALTRYDDKSLTDADGNTYTGYIYSNSGSTSAVYVSIEFNAGDIVTLVVGSNGGDSLINFEAPSGAIVTGQFLSSGAKAQLLTFYPTESGAYKIYSTTEKLVLARVYRETPSTVSVTGSVSAPAALTDYSIVFTNTASGAVTTAPVENGSYSADLLDGYSYDVSLENANGYIITDGKSLTIEKGAASASLDIQVLAVDLVTVSGTIHGLDEAALGKLDLQFQADALYKPEITISGNSYTAQVELGQEYTLVAEGINDYAIAGSVIVSYSEDTTADITFEAKPLYPITIAPEGASADDLAEATFTFTNLNEPGYVYTFTGTEGIALRDGVYSVAVTNSGNFVQKLTSNLKVNGAAVTKPIAFNNEITLWDFTASDFTGGGYNGGAGTYNGLSWTNGKSHNGVYLYSGAGTISVPVKGSCQIVVSACYQYSFYFENENEASVNVSTGSTSQIDAYTYNYNGGAGTVDITVLGTCYFNKIEIIQTIPYAETITVGASGCDYTTINAALDAVAAMPRPNNERVTILIQPGNYEEMLVIDVPNVTLKNASSNPSIGLINQGVDIEAEAVRITWYYGHGYTYYSMGPDCKYDEEILQVNKENGYPSFENPGSGTTAGSYWNATVVVRANGFQAEGIIFENSFNQYISEKAAADIIVAQGGAKEGSIARADLPVGSTAVQDKAYVERAAALAIADNCSQIYFENCKFVGRQDTFYGGKGATVALYDCAIYGGTDYIFGGMTAVFAKCDLVFNTSENNNDVGYITAAQQTQGRGYLMYNCTITSTTPGVDTASEYPSKPGYLGRPWQANTSEVIFYHTIIEASDTHWYGTSPSLIRPDGWLSTLSGESNITGEYATYEYALNVDNSGNRVSWAQVFSEALCADGTPITVENFLGQWDPFADKDMTIEIPIEKVDNAPKQDEDEDDNPSGNTHFVLDSTLDLESMAAGEKADGDTLAIGTDGFFTVIFSAKTKIDGSNKNFADGYTASQRINFGGKTDPGKGMINTVKFTTDGPATIKLWWVSGGDGREMAIYDANGNVIASTDASESVKNSLYISELTVDAAGTYYIGVPTGSNYLFKAEVDVTPEEIPGTGDAIFLTFALLAVSAAALVVLLRKKRAF